LGNLSLSIGELQLLAMLPRL